MADAGAIAEPQARLVAKGHCNDKLPAGEGVRPRQRQYGGNDDGSGMQRRSGVGIVKFETVDRGAVGKRGKHGRLWPENEMTVRAYMLAERQKRKEVA